jgi:hypothetical protein
VSSVGVCVVPAAAGPLVAPIALAAAAGLLALSGRVRRTRWSPTALLVVAVLAWGALAFPVAASGVPAAYRLRTSQSPEQPLGLVYGDNVELVGYSLPGAARPGDWLDVVLFWRARAPEGENLTLAVHAVGTQGADLAGYDGPPAGAGFPTNMWRPGELLRMPYRLRLDSRADVPTAAAIAVGLRGPGNVGQPWLPRDPTGQLLEHGPRVARFALRGPPIEATAEPRARFAGGIDFVDWSLPPVASRGGTVTGRLVLRARGTPARDATLFVQLLGPGRLLGQWDAQPRRGAYPTSIWPSGEVVQDDFELRIAPDAPPGEYPVIAGLYVLPETQRLLLPTGADHVDLGRLRVQP